jgi:hypothetical protein
MEVDWRRQCEESFAEVREKLEQVAFVVGAEIVQESR